jgi:hypothetical protein
VVLLAHVSYLTGLAAVVAYCTELAVILASKENSRTLGAWKDSKMKNRKMEKLFTSPCLFQFSHLGEILNDPIIKHFILIFIYEFSLQQVYYDNVNLARSLDIPFCL